MTDIITPGADEGAELVENVAVAPEAEEVAVKEEVAVSEAAPASGGKGAAVLAAVKEWFRKRAVNLKRKPQTIPFLLLIVCSVFYLLTLNDFSRTAAVKFYNVPWLGASVFINTLFSILVLVLFLNAFPKYPIVSKRTGKKYSVNYLMLGLGFAFIAVMITMNAVFMHQLLSIICENNESVFFKTVEEALAFKPYLSDKFIQGYEAGKPASELLDASTYLNYVMASYRYAIAHIVLLGVTVIAYATLPLYKKLIMKINTAKVIESNNMNEVIDTED